MNSYAVCVPGHESLGNLSLMQASAIRREMRRVGYDATIRQEVLTTK